MTNPIARREDSVITIVCPAKGCLLMLPVRALGTARRPDGPEWEFDGNIEAPTLAPSLLNHCTAGICHSFLRAGRFEFLSDCTHEKAGQTIPLEPLPDCALD